MDLVRGFFIGSFGKLEPRMDVNHPPGDPDIRGESTAMLSITPITNETQAGFALRFHTAMAEVMPRTDERTSACFQAWRDSGREASDPCTRVAAENFPMDQYKLVRDVPVFAEHRTKQPRLGEDGTVVEEMVIYDRRALEQISDKCNLRISDTANFAALSDGHTPTAKERASGIPIPDVLGYSGPYRLGMIGNDNPRWAIFCDEHHQLGDVERLQKRRRRSAELWLDPNMGERFMEPIAALGAQAPRLDMGAVKFSMTEDGTTLVARYEAASPSATNAFIPGEMGEERKSYYQSELGDKNMISPEDVQQITEAFLQTAPMQWVVSQMENGPDSGAAPPMDPGAAPPMDPAGPPMDPAVPPAAPPAPEKYEADEASDEELEIMDEDRKECYDRLSGPERVAFMSAIRLGSHGRGEYRELKANYRKLQDDHESLKSRVDNSEQETAVARYSTELSELKGKGYEIEIDAELKHAAGFSDAQREAHLDIITERYSRIPLADHTPALNTPNISIARKDADKYTEDRCAAAQKYCLDQREQHGKEVTFAQAIDILASEEEAVPA